MSASADPLIGYDLIVAYFTRIPTAGVLPYFFNSRIGSRLFIKVRAQVLPGFATRNHLARLPASEIPRMQSGAQKISNEIIWYQERHGIQLNIDNDRILMCPRITRNYILCNLGEQTRWRIKDMPEMYICRWYDLHDFFYLKVLKITNTHLHT